MSAPCCLLVAVVYSASLSNKAIESHHEGWLMYLELLWAGHLCFIVQKAQSGIRFQVAAHNTPFSPSGLAA